MTASKERDRPRAAGVDLSHSPPCGCSCLAQPAPHSRSSTRDPKLFNETHHLDLVRCPKGQMKSSGMGFQLSTKIGVGGITRLCPRDRLLVLASKNGSLPNGELVVFR